MLLASADEGGRRSRSWTWSSGPRRNRLAVEARQSVEFLANAADKTQAESGERVLMDAWRKWYSRALESVLALPVTATTERLRDRVKAAQAEINQAPL